MNRLGPTRDHAKQAMARAPAGPSPSSTPCQRRRSALRGGPRTHCHLRSAPTATPGFRPHAQQRRAADPHGAGARAPRRSRARLPWGSRTRSARCPALSGGTGCAWIEIAGRWDDGKSVPGPTRWCCPGLKGQSWQSISFAPPSAQRPRGRRPSAPASARWNTPSNPDSHAAARLRRGLEAWCRVRRHGC